MRARNHKCLIYCILAVFGGVFSLSMLTGCSDDPESAAAKKVREITAQALEASVNDKDYERARDQVVGALGQNRASGLTKDAAHLASGSLWLAQGRQSQSNLDLKVLPIRSTANLFEKLLRESESLVLENERIAALLAGGEKEVAELDQLLAGDTEKAGLETQLETAQAGLEKLLNEKKGIAAEKDKAQAVLDDYQSRADALRRKAELAQGDEKLKLEKDSFAILHDRKAYYIEAQSAEDEMVVLAGRVALSQTTVDGLSQSILETRQRIDSITRSETRVILKRQMGEIQTTLSDNQQRMGSIAGDIQVGINAYKDESLEVCGVFENAAAEFEMINSQDAEFSATLRLAESYHCAALTCSSFIMVEMDLSARLQDLMETADPAFVTLLAQKLPIQSAADNSQSPKAMGFFDQAIETYDQAFNRAGSLSRSLGASDKHKAQEAKSSVLKSQLLAVDNKMLLAERLQQYEVVDAMVVKTDELIERGAEFGVSFTQSETVKLIKSGIDYTPSLPVNLDVYADDLKKKLSEWKRLPIAEQEVAVAENLMTIENSVSRYGDELARGLEPLKQEMLAAQKRGFKESGNSGGFNDPNNF